MAAASSRFKGGHFRIREKFESIGEREWSWELDEDSRTRALTDDILEVSLDNMIQPAEPVFPSTVS